MTSDEEARRPRRLVREDPPLPVDGVYDVVALAHALGINARYLQTILTEPDRMRTKGVTLGLTPPTRTLAGAPVWTRAEVKRIRTVFEAGGGSWSE